MSRRAKWLGNEKTGHCTTRQNFTLETRTALGFQGEREVLRAKSKIIAELPVSTASALLGIPRKVFVTQDDLSLT